MECNDWNTIIQLAKNMKTWCEFVDSPSSPRDHGDTGEYM